MLVPRGDATVYQKRTCGVKHKYVFQPALACYGVSTSTDAHTTAAGDTSMTRIRKLAFAALVALALVGGAPASPAAPQYAKVNEYEGQHRVAVNEYEGQHRVAVNEYEGQHRVSAAG
jgi:hypothetical protein